jgi:hypothetical protein
MLNKDELLRRTNNGLDVKERTAKNYIKFMREIILKDSSNTSYFILENI